MPPINLLIKPASSACNLACRYCFYKDVAEHRAQPFQGMLSLERLEAAVRFGLSYAEQTCSFTFQGGEPTLAGLAFYQEAVRLQRKHARSGIRIQNAIQTNGYLLDEAWAAFFGENQFLVGLSLDGPAALHDRNRQDPKGHGTFQRTMHAAQLLKKHHVPFNILCVVTRQHANAAERIYRFFRKQGFGWLQFIPCVEPFTPSGENVGYHLSAESYGGFLIRIFDLWYRDLQQGEYVSIRHFDNWLAILLGGAPEACNMAGRCSIQFVVEGDGSVYPCDFYVLDEWNLGHIDGQSAEQLLETEPAKRFLKTSCALPKQCADCQWLMLCRNGCRRDRAVLLDGSPGVNRYCKAHQVFFSQRMPQLQNAARLLLHMRKSI